jgi:hypothetical protein
MSLISAIPTRTLAILILMWHFVGLAHAQSLSQPQAIWHCSRNLPGPPSTNAMVEQDEFKLSSMDTIGVILSDLIDVYSGSDVRIGNMPLIGCFMPGQDALSKNILNSLNLKPYVLQKLSAQSTIVLGQLVSVTDEEQMQICLSKYFPSFGYLSSEVISEKFAPCF